MQIQIENIGKIKSAKLVIPSIAVIAGENNTGKSTISKSIYSFFQGTKDTEEEHLKEQYEALERDYGRLRNYFIHKQSMLEEGQFADSLEQIDVALTNRNHQAIFNEIELLKEKINQSSNDNSEKKDALYELDNFTRKLYVDVTSNSYKLHYLEQIFKNEFSNSICSTNVKNEQGFFSLGKNQLVFDQNQLDESKTKLEHFKNLGAIYIDNPFVMDELSISVRRPYFYMTSLTDHFTHLKKLLIQAVREQTIFDDYVNTAQFDRIFNEVLNGSIKIGNKGVQFEEKKTGSIYPLKNLATGMKSFFILQQLIVSGELQKIDILILDEPEVHLHPNWQLKYAELIVLLSIQFNLKVLVTSHSPYFVEAIEQLSKKYKIKDEVKYYRTILTEDGNVLKDVTDDLPNLYNDFATPFIELEKMRDAYEDID